MPAALAMAEREGAGGSALLRAFALGYDIGTRLSIALGGYAFSAPVLGSRRARCLIDTVWSLEKVRNVRSLHALLRA